MPPAANSATLGVRCQLHSTCNRFSFGSVCHKLLHVVCVHLQVGFKRSRFQLCKRKHNDCVCSQTRPSGEHSWFATGEGRGDRHCVRLGCPYSSSHARPPHTLGPQNANSFNVGLKSCLRGGKKKTKKLCPDMWEEWGGGEVGGPIYSIKEEVLKGPREPQSRAGRQRVNIW